jgi:mono/diheme cytochrome c family protein
MKRLLLLTAIFITACGPSQEEKTNISAVTCSIMAETRNMDGAVRVREINNAREKIGGEPFLGGDDAIQEAFAWGLCQELVLNENYDEIFQTLKAAESERERKEKVAESERERKEKVAKNEREREVKAFIYQTTIGKQWTFDELMVKGEEVYGRSCAGCHQANGEGIAGVFPALKDSPIALGPAEGHIDILINGVAGTSMQSFAEQLSEVDIAAVIHYNRNSWGNDMGDIIQPIDILK